MQNVPPGTLSPAFIAFVGDVTGFRVRLGVLVPRPLTRAEAIGRPEHHGRTRYHRPGGRFASRRAPLMRFSSPSALAGFASRSASAGSQPGDNRLTETMWHRSTRWTCGVGRSIHLATALARRLLVDRQDARPAVFDRSRGRFRWNRLIALASNPAMSSAATSLSGTDPGHAPTRLFARCSAPRQPILAAWTGERSFPLEREP